MSIVVTAVYILRAIGNVAMGQPHPQPFSPGGEGGNTLTDAKWNERLAAIILVVGILAIGIAPGWLNDLLRPAAEEIMKRIAAP
jgi:NADH-quinone oxidoreductase subunit M